MLALARARLSRPRLLLLDEPSLGPGADHRRAVLRARPAAERGAGPDRPRRRAERERGAGALEPRVPARGRARRARGCERRAARARRHPKVVPGLLMAEFIQQVVAGLGDGAIYASLALALVLIYRATHVINFAQGEMGMVSTYIAWAMITNHGWSYWPAFVFTLGISFLGGFAIHETVIRPLHRAGELTVVMATIALLVILNGLVSWIWQPDEKILVTPLAGGTWSVGSVAIPQQSVYDLIVVLVCVARAVAALQVHEARARAARVGRRSLGEQAARRARAVDALDRLGIRRDPVCRRRDARSIGAIHLHARLHAGHDHLRVRRSNPRRPGEPGRRRDRRAHCSASRSTCSAPTSRARSRPTCACRSRSRSCCSCSSSARRACSGRTAVRRV